MKNPYPKIETLFKRNPETFKVTDEIRCPEFSNIKKWLVSEKIDGCLHYTQRITTDRGNIPIGKIVNQQLPVNVASYNKELDVIEFRKIVHYHKEKRIRPFMSIGVKSRLKGNKEKFIVCTDNHKFFSNSRWIQAKELEKGMKLFHFGNLITEDTRQLILGMLLGDASIFRPSQQTRGFSFLHSTEQSDYFDFKAGLLGNLFHETTGAIGGFNGSKENRRGSSVVNPAISELIINTCEVARKKFITKKWINSLLPLAIAIWYMDDGSCNFGNKQRPRARIATNGFSFEEVELLCAVLNEKYGIAGKVFNYNGPVICLTADGTERFFNIIYPYIPNCMKYKLPERFKDTPCAITPTISQYLGLLETEVTSINKKFPKRASSLKPMNRYQYDLTIERNSNYFASSILVHNTNVRVLYNGIEDNLEFRGRTDKAQMPIFLLDKLKNIFSIDKLREQFNDVKNISLYGEGYGPRINKGGVYRSKEAGVSFRLIDIKIGHWWLEWDSIIDIAKSLDIKTVPNLGILELLPAIKLINNRDERHDQLYSKVAEEENNRTDILAEGIVARSHPLVLFRNGNPVVWKLKQKDF